MPITAPIQVGQFSWADRKPDCFGIRPSPGEHVEPLIARPLESKTGVQTSKLPSFNDAVRLGRNPNWGTADGAVGVFRDGDGTRSLGRLFTGEAALTETFDKSAVGIPAPRNPSWIRAHVLSDTEVGYARLTQAGKGASQLEAIVGGGSQWIDLRNAEVVDGATHVMTKG